MIIRQEEELLESEKKLQEKIRSVMVQTTYEFEKLLNYSTCSERWLMGGNVSYIKENCYKFFGGNEGNTKVRFEFNFFIFCVFWLILKKLIKFICIFD